MKRIAILLLLTGIVLTLFTGCVMRSADELYTLPKQAQDYYNLQQAVDAAMKNASYCAPVGGENCQAVQLKDLDNDGKNEAIVFARTEGEHPLKVFVFKRDGDVFSQIASLEGDGTSFASVQYAQLDGQGGVELIVGRQISDEVLQALSVYALRDGELVRLMSANYNAFTTLDMDEDGCKDIFLVREDSALTNGAAELYRWNGVQLRCEKSTELSFPAESIRRMLAGALEDKIPAVFVAGAYDDNNLITDVFSVKNGQLCCVTRPDGTEAEAAVIRSNQLFAVDIDSDGVTELPRTAAIALAEGSQTQHNWIVCWYSLTLDGTAEVKKLTYQDDTDLWYIELLQRWQDSLAVSGQTRPDGTRETVLYQRDAATGTLQPIFTIYAMDGSGAAEEAEERGAFVLASRGDTTFAAVPGTAEFASELTQEDLTEWFHVLPEAEAPVT